MCRNSRVIATGSLLNFKLCWTLLSSAGLPFLTPRTYITVSVLVMCLLILSITRRVLSLRPLDCLQVMGLTAIFTSTAVVFKFTTTFILSSSDLAAFIP